jgi:hypothetical protein
LELEVGSKNVTIERSFALVEHFRLLRRCRPAQPVLAIRTNPVRTISQGGESETAEDEVDYSGIHSWRHHDVGRLQEEAATTASASATTASGADGFDFRQSQ